jgi:hypothetical protein
VLEDRLPLGDVLLGPLLGGSLLSGAAAVNGPSAMEDGLSEAGQSDPGTNSIALFAAGSTDSTPDATPLSLDQRVQDQRPADKLSSPEVMLGGTGLAQAPDWTQLPALAIASAPVPGSGMSLGGSGLLDMGVQAVTGAFAPSARLDVTPSFAGFHPPGETPLAGLSVPAAEGAASQPTAAQESVVRQNYGQLPFSFEANVGQADSQVQFLAQGSGYSLFLTPTEAVMTLSQGSGVRDQGSGMGGATTLPTRTANEDPASLSPNPQALTPPSVVRMQVLGGNPAPQVVGLDPLPGKVNYFLGNDPRQWHTNISTYAKVEYRDVYPGIDLDYYGRQGQMEYDFVVAPGADPGAIHLGFSGADQVNVDSQGDLVLHAGGQDVVQHKPVVYQDVNGSRQEVASSLVLADKPNSEATNTHQIGFALGSYDASRALVIDPVLSYSTYLGGSGGNYGSDVGLGIAVDAAGNAYVTGYTDSTDFPTANAFQPSKGGLYTPNAFVTKLSADGSSLVYSSYLGGSGYANSSGDYGNGIAVDAAGNAYVTGYAASTDFPTANAFQPNKGGPYIPNAFVTKLSADGSSLVYSTYLGGSGTYGDYGTGIAVDAAGNAYVTGHAESTDFPTANAFQPAKGGASYIANAFVTKFAADGANLLYSTYLGGSIGDVGNGIAVNAAGNAYVTGLTISTDFPTANAFQPTKGGGSNVYNAFLTKFSSDGASLVYSTYLGASAGDSGNGIAVDAAGNAYVTGFTYSTDFPTANAVQPSNQGAATQSPNAFVTKVSADGASLLYSTYLGGSGHDFGFGDQGQAIAVDAAGDAYVAGYTYSTDFPTASAFQPTKGGGSYVGNAFVTKFAADGTSLVYSSYLGGSGYGNGSGGDAASGIAVDGTGNAYVAGGTGSFDFPTVNAFQLAKGGTGAFQSLDGGTTWNVINGAQPNALTNFDIRSMAVDPVTSSTVYAATFGAGIFRSDDAGGTWSAINNGLTDARIQVVLVDPVNPAHLYAGTNSGGVFQSVDGGASWTGSNNGLTDLNVKVLVTDPTNASIVYAGTNSGGVFRSNDGGASWTASGNGLTSTNIRCMAVDPATPTTVYAATDGGIFKSTDGGDSWFPANNGLPTSLQGYALALDPTQPSTLYAGISYKSDFFTYYSVYKTTNGGTNWSYTSNGLYVLANTLVIDPAIPSTVYAATSGGVYKTVNGGTSWSKSGLSGEVQALALDPTAPSTVYAGNLGTGISNAFVAKIS